VVGVDVDPAVSRNGRVSSGARASAYHLPFRDEAFDIVYSRYVFEHLERPREAFGEIARVLRPGGITIILTPNKAHYVALISRFTPHWFHRFVNEKLRGRPAEETFPTVYRANTRRALNALARSAGLEPAQVRMVELRPNYLMWGVLPFLLGVAYERLVNSTAWLEDLRVNIVAAYRKPGSRGGQARPAVQARAVARGGGTSPS
jgi:SAM-dependent methyltransferase